MVREGKEIQTEFLEIMEKRILRNITEKKTSGMFSLMANETADIANTELPSRHRT